MFAITIDQDKGFNHSQAKVVGTSDIIRDGLQDTTQWRYFISFD
jgi:hypothetical protein